MQIYDGMVRIWKDDTASVTSRCHYAWARGLYDGLCVAIELIPEATNINTWKNTLKKFCDLVLELTAKSIWNRMPRVFTEKDLDFRSGHLYEWMTHLPSIREKYEVFSNYNDLDYKFIKRVTAPAIEMFYGVILKKSQKIF